MRADGVTVGDRVAGSRVVACWGPEPGWRAIQTADGRTMLVEDGQDVPAVRGPQPTLDVGLA